MGLGEGMRHRRRQQKRDRVREAGARMGICV